MAGFDNYQYNTLNLDSSNTHLCIDMLKNSIYFSLSKTQLTTVFHTCLLVLRLPNRFHVFIKGWKCLRSAQTK